MAYYPLITPVTPSDLEHCIQLVHYLPCQHDQFQDIVFAESYSDWVQKV